MDYQVNRFVINVSDENEKSSTDQLDMDFFIQPERRKVILGTVRLPDGRPAPCSVVKFFRLRDDFSDTESLSALEPVGHAITDENGQFILGPVNPGEKIVLKIFYQENSLIQSEEVSVRGTYEPEDN